mgnify:CR=1 FL=1
MRLSDFTTLAFDCYGTLIDWESGMVEALRPLAAGEDVQAAVAPHQKERQLAFHGA